MRIVRFKSFHGVRLGACIDDRVVDITEAGGRRLSSFLDLASEAFRKGLSIDAFVKKIIDESPADLPAYSYANLERGEGGMRLLIPIEPPEVWGCGVTYRRSVEVRESETKARGVYDLVYEAPRPEIFFKATAHRCAGPGEEICVRGDSRLTVPEAELAFILGFNGEIIGFTGGNDASASDIENENPLYLPQAKIFMGCCALGPSIVTVEEVGHEPKLKIDCRVFRNGKPVFEGSTNTSMMKRSLEELRSYLCRYNPIPPGSACLTGTGIIPPAGFTLEEGDTVEITTEKIGTLRNHVRRL